ncbi:MAG: type II toxin-antitoxin system RelE/ParE family toxin, partial [Alphaproteobacteria bacterium]|nr:type II toxin-antitoxin system RelE/ParE family toxin [Alphaproteobacteria bacterium]
MIISFRCKETQKIWLGLFSKKFPPTLQHLVLRKLRLIDAAHSIEDLKVPPGNHLELLKGNRAG